MADEIIPVIVEAIAKVEEKEDVAVKIAEAALQTNHGQKIESLEKDLIECRLTLETLPNLLMEKINPIVDALSSQHRSAMVEMETRLLNEVAVVREKMNSLPQNILIPQQQQEPMVEVKEAELEPEPEPAPARKRNRLV